MTDDVRRLRQCMEPLTRWMDPVDLIGELLGLQLRREPLPRPVRGRRIAIAYTTRPTEGLVDVATYTAVQSDVGVAWLADEAGAEPRGDDVIGWAWLPDGPAEEA